MFRQPIEGAHKEVTAAAAKAVRESTAKGACEQIHNPARIGYGYLPAPDLRW